GSTLIFVTLGVILFSKYQKDYLFNGIFNKAFVYFSFFFATSMFTVAIELYFFGAPFLLTWFTTALGELVSLLIGSLIIDKLS
ncbi:TPA: queuosine transporter QueT, partial [Streptococcus pyogenes]|nr:queuosine transporter QueT [Streptococcus pyogenes]